MPATATARYEDHPQVSAEVLAQMWERRHRVIGKLERIKDPYLRREILEVADDGRVLAEVLGLPGWMPGRDRQKLGLR